MIIENKQLQLDEVATKYYDEIFAYIKRRVRTTEDAYDLTQDVFLIYTQTSEKINAEKIRKWLYRVAHNNVVDYYKRVKKETEIYEYGELNEEQLGFSLDCNDNLTEQEEVSYKREIIASLSNEDRQLYEDVCIRKMKVHDLSPIYGVTEAALHKRVTRMKHKIRQMIKAVLYLIFS